MFCFSYLMFGFVIYMSLVVFLCEQHYLVSYNLINSKYLWSYLINKNLIHMLLLLRMLSIYLCIQYRYTRFVLLFNIGIIINCIYNVLLGLYF